MCVHSNAQADQILPEREGGGGEGGGEKESEIDRLRERDAIDQIEIEIEIDRDRKIDRKVLHPRTENGCFRRRQKKQKGKTPWVQSRTRIMQDAG